MFRQNAANTGQTALSGPRALEMTWRYQTGGFTYSTPTVTNDAIYITSNESLVALNLDGSMRWTVPFGGSTTVGGITVSGIVSSPAIGNNGNVYVGSLDNNVYTVDSSGNIIAMFDTGGEVFSSPVIGPDGTVYIGSESGIVAALNPDGTLRNSIPLSGEIYSTPAYANGFIYVGTTANLLYVLNAATLNPVRVFSTTEDVISSPAVGSNGIVYFASADGQVYAGNDQGQFEWNQPFSTGDLMISSPAIGQNGTIYIGSVDSSLYAINANGTLKWTYNTGNSIASSPIVDANGWIFVISFDGILHALQDGGSQANLQWSFDANAEAPAWASPTIGANNTLYMAVSGTTNSSGFVQAFREAAYNVSFIPSPPLVGQPLEVTVSLPGSQVIEPVTFNFRAAGASAFTPLPINGSTTIPGDRITGDGLVYFVQGNQGTVPSVTPQANPVSQPVLALSAQSANDFIPRRYQMASVPYFLPEPGILDVLDEYAPYDPANWRLLRWNVDEYLEFPNFEDEFTPGTAFFMVTSDNEPFSVERGTSLNTSVPFVVELQPGWNQVGNPFGFPVAWADIIRDPAVVTSAAFFDGSDWIQDPDGPLTLFPWNGLLVYNASSEPVFISIPGTPSRTDVVDQEANALQSAGTRVQLVASLDGTSLKDTQNWIGFHPDARHEEDPLDVREAPPFGEHVRLSIGDANQPFALSYKPLPAEGSEWPLVLSRGVSNPSKHTSVELALYPEADFPETYEMALIDDDYGYAHVVSEERVTISWEDLRDQRRLRLLVGTRPYIESVLGDLPIAPETNALEPNYPNPFRGATTIQYRLNQRTDVSLIVYDALGREVRSLVRATQNPGTFDVLWDGLDSSGRALPSGLYFYRLIADDYEASGQMALIR